MEKSRFNKVFFKGLNRFMYFDGDRYWKLETLDYNFACCERFIVENPEFFEIEKTEREFEEGAYYKAKMTCESDWEIIKRNDGRFQRINVFGWWENKYFYEIGEKIQTN